MVPAKESEMRLNELRDNPGATKSKKRVGRGPGSGKGKTAGRGIKGQKSRSGVAINGYEGGQMPLYQRLPKRGFNNINAKKYAVINLGILQKFIDNGKIDIEKPVTEKAMVDSGLVRRIWDGVRLLNKGEISSRVNLEVTGASRPAIASVEKIGGTVKVLKSAMVD
jgi:large subunit ribosomal protein L15